MRNVGQRLLGLVATALLVSSCSSSTATASQPPAINEDQIRTEVASFLGDRDGGVDILLTSGDSAARVAVGVADADATPLEPGRPFRVGSISKPFVATMVLQLAEEGSVELDEPIGTYLPGLPVGSEASVRDLLGHRSGVPNYTDQPRFSSDVLADPDKVFTPYDVLAYVALAAPGSSGRFSYSNTNYILLGLLVEAIDGTDLGSALATRISEPAGLPNTRFATPGVPNPEQMVGGWSAQLMNGDPTAEYDALESSAWAAGALISTADDLARFLQALSDGQLLSETSFAEMAETSADGYGLGLARVEMRAGQTGVGHGGSIPGYSSTMAIDPATGETIVVLTNNDQLVADLLASRLLSLN